MSNGFLRKKLVDIGNKWHSKIILGIPQAPCLPNKSYKTKKSFYIVPMFPYPSGNLHMGHVRVYIISDTLNRYHQMKGERVIHPIGWDSFGLPAENAAIERNLDPSIWTQTNIENMKKQILKMGINFNWDLELSTCQTDYYKFTQWLFLKLFENGLAYKKEAEINWDPVDMTVLANEQIDSKGRSWRSGAVVEKKLLSQWFLNITKFVNELDSDLNILEHWPQNVKIMQKNWIGMEKIHKFTFKIENCPLTDGITISFQNVNQIESVNGINIPLNHQLTKTYMEKNKSLLDFVKGATNLNKHTQTTFKLQDVFAINPINNSKIPILVRVASNGLPEATFEATNSTIQNDTLHASGEIAKNTDFLNIPSTKRTNLGKTNKDTYKTTIAKSLKDSLIELRNQGTYNIIKSFKLRDWLISRQRYWGTPIPIIYCNNCGIVPVPGKDLPVKLPPTSKVIKKNGNPLEHIHDFVNCRCPKCDSPAKRETDTMDTFMDSSWYFFRYLDPKNDTLPFKKEIINEKMPVDVYIGGVEHSILHLLYARFISKFLGSIGLWNSKNCEPFNKLLTQGMVQGRTFVDTETEQYLKPEEVEMLSNGSFQNKKTKAKVTILFEKMSKSKHNGVNPNQFIDFNGPDATRAHILFQAPVNEVLLWGKTNINGIQRWLEKLINLTNEIFRDQNIEDASELALSDELNKDELNLLKQTNNYVKYITSNLDNGIALNTVISDYMKLTNIFQRICSSQNKVRKPVLYQEFKKFVSMLYPVIPAVTEELIEIIKREQPCLKDWNPYEWPILQDNTVITNERYKVIVDGKLKCTFMGEKDLFQKDEGTIHRFLLNNSQTAKFVKDGRYRKQLYPGIIIFSDSTSKNAGKS